MQPHDITGFIPLTQPPDTLHFNWNNLPDTIFNYDALPSTPLHFEISVLKKPEILKASLKLKSNVANPLYDFGEPINGTEVRSVFKDKDGFVWIASNHMLYKYDGSNLSAYNIGLKKAFIQTMMQDDKGRIWLGTGITHSGNNHNPEGIFVLDEKNNLLKHLPATRGLSNSETNGIMEDGQGRIWVTTDSCVNIIEEQNFKIRYLGRAQGLPGNITIGITRDEQNNIWINCLFGGLSIINEKAHTIKYFKPKPAIDTTDFVAMLKSSDNKIWIGGFENEVKSIDVSQGIMCIYNKRQGLKNENVISLKEDNEGNIWIAHDFPRQNNSAIEVLNPSKQSLKKIIVANGLNTNDLKDLCYDGQQVWVGTSNGLNVIDTKFRHHGDEEVSSLAEDRNGRIWIADIRYGAVIFDTANNITYSFTTKQGLSDIVVDDIDTAFGKILLKTDGGLDVVDYKTHLLEHYGKKEGLFDDVMSYTMKDRQGNIWVCDGTSYKQVIDLLDLKNKTVTHFDSSEGLHCNAIYRSVQDKKGNVWFSCYDEGRIYLLNPYTKTVKHTQPNTAFSFNSVKNILTDEKDNIWFGTDNGLYMINAANDSVTVFTPAEGLSGNYIKSLNELNGIIYAATTTGVTIITPPNLSKNNYWKLQVLGGEHGLVKAVYTQNCNIITNTGSYLWGDKGITSFSTKENFANPSSTYITGIDIFNRALSFSNNPWKTLNINDTITNDSNRIYTKDRLPGGIIFPDNKAIKFDSATTIFNLPAGLKLPYYDNYLQFHFVQPAVAYHDAIGYKYILEGVDKNWSKMTYNNVSPDYLNLSPGSYIFKVASFSNGEWGNTAVFSFTITAPWWKTWWAYILYIILLVALIWAFVVYRSKNLQRQNKLLEEKVNQRTNQLNRSIDELKSTQAQLIQSEKMASLGELTAGIAHEIQNPLNFVNNFSEVNQEMIDEVTEEIDKGNINEVKNILNDIKDNEEKINHHGKRADAIVKGMLQHSRQTKGVKEPTDINALCDEYLRLSYHGLRAKDKNFNANFKTDFDESIDKINIVPQDIGRVFLNIFNNSFYAVNEKKKSYEVSGRSYEPLVLVQTKKLSDAIEIKVGDNGNGIPSNIVDKIFQPFFTTKPTGQGTGLGLSFAYDIITKEHSGTIRVESKECEGSAFIIQLPVTS